MLRDTLSMKLFYFVTKILCKLIICEFLMSNNNLYIIKMNVNFGEFSIAPFIYSVPLYLKFTCSLNYICFNHFSLLDVNTPLGELRYNK